MRISAVVINVLTVVCAVLIISNCLCGYYLNQGVASMEPNTKQSIASLTSLNVRRLLGNNDKSSDMTLYIEDYLKLPWTRMNWESQFEHDLIYKVDVRGEIVIHVVYGIKASDSFQLRRYPVPIGTTSSDKKICYDYIGIIDNNSPSFKLDSFNSSIDIRGHNDVNIFDADKMQHLDYNIRDLVRGSKYPNYKLETYTFPRNSTVYMRGYNSGDTFYYTQITNDPIDLVKSIYLNTIVICALFIVVLVTVGEWIRF
jgi:hypothetical protein